MSNVKMKKITPKTFEERHGECAPSNKHLPSGHMDFDDNKDLKNCVIGSKVIIMQEVTVTRISKEGIGYDINKMGAKKVRNQRNTNKKNY